MQVLFSKVLVQLVKLLIPIGFPLLLLDEQIEKLSLVGVHGITDDFANKTRLTIENLLLDPLVDPKIALEIIIGICRHLLGRSVGPKPAY